MQGGAGAGAGGLGGGALDFARLQGQWTGAHAGDPALACLRSPILVRADGRLGVWGGDASGNQSLLASLACQPSGQCEVLTSNIPPESWPAGLELVERGGGLGLCADGNCMDLASCLLAATPAGLEERIAGEMDRAGSQGATSAPVTEVPALQLPPGIWLADFEPEGQGIRPGSPKFREACHDFPTIAYPDGTTITLERRDEAAGRAYSVVFTESCKP